MNTKNRHTKTPMQSFQIDKIDQDVINTCLQSCSGIGAFERLPNLGICYLPAEHCTGHDSEAAENYNGLDACKYKVIEMTYENFTGIFFNNHDHNFYTKRFDNSNWILEGNVLKPR